MNQEKLIEKVEEYLSVKKKIQEIKDLVVPPFVNKPIIAKSKEWNEYIKKKIEYDNAVHAKGKGLDDQEKRRGELWSEIKDMLPASNTWFVTDDEKYAVGHRSIDWPLDPGKLMIKENPVISELTEIIPG